MIKINKQKIRLKNFNDIWSLRKLSDTQTDLKDGNYGEAYPKETDLTSSTQGVPFLRGSDLDNGKLTLTNARYITQSKHNELVSGHLIEDDIVIAVRGSLGSLGYVGPDNEGWNINSQLAIIRTRKIELIGNYLIQFLLSNRGNKEISSHITGTALKQLPIKQLKNIKVPIPKIEEQSAIGSLFRILDELLTSYKDNLVNYQSLKAVMLSKMFPKAGQTVPEIRLDGFEGEWELIKLGEVCDLITKGTTAKSQSEQGKVNFVKVENLKDNKIYPVVKISEEEHLGSLKRSILYEGDILFSIAGTLGRTAIVRNNILPANTNQALAIIRGYKLDAYFLLVVLSGEVVKDYIRKNPTVGAQPNLSLEQISSLKIQVPSIEEQQAIGSYFSNLDNLIVAHQDKIFQLETLKKKLLQDMFL